MTWYVAITNPNCHRRAESGLAELGYRAFWPKLRRWVSHARTKVAKEYPVFGRYVFVEIPDRNFYGVRAVDGIEALLVDENGSPAKVREDLVWSFRERYMAGEWDFVSTDRPLPYWTEEDGEMVKKWRMNPAMPHGARVRVMAGEFENLLTIIRKDDDGKLTFLPPGKRQFSSIKERNVRAV